MIGSTSRQASLFYFAFAKEAMAITDDVLDPLDPLLQDPQLVQVATQALAKRRALYADFGRPSIAPDRLLRCVIEEKVKLIAGYKNDRLTLVVRGNEARVARLN